MTILYNPLRGTFKHSFLTREQLRKIARLNNVPRGRNTKDTIDNLKAAGVIV